MADADNGWIVLDGVRKSDRVAQQVAGGLGVDLALLIPAILVSEGSIAAASAHPVEVNLRSDEFRFGRTVLPFADVTRGLLGVSDTGRSRVLELNFGHPGELMMVAPLISGDKRQLDPSTRVLLGNALERTSIAMPADRYDPNGRCARYNFPENVTKEQTVDLVFNPPMPGEELPIPE